LDKSQSIRQLRAPELLRWVVAPSEEALRLDSFLARRLVVASKREIVELITSHQVQVNGRCGKKGLRVWSGDTVTAPFVASLQPNHALPIKVVHVDDALIVVDKPAGIASVALRHTDMATVANFLLAHFPETATASPSPLEAGLTHRLDTATSGLLLAARTPAMYAALRAQFHSHLPKKNYYALVVGGLCTGGTFSAPLAPAGKGRQWMRVDYGNTGQAASTTYIPLEVLPGSTLVHVSITTGVRHQIRVHLAALGYPIVGDTLYGAAKQTVRLCLHATALALLHPLTQRTLHVTSPLPADFLEVVGSYRNERGNDAKGPLQTT
jgi:23S rRNA pseudouridine1911/1915/1917 synthase